MSMCVEERERQALFYASGLYTVVNYAEINSDENIWSEKTEQKHSPTVDLSNPQSQHAIFICLSLQTEMWSILMK